MLRRWYRIYVGPWGFRVTCRELWEKMAMVPLPAGALLEAVSCVFFLTAVGLRKTQCLGLKYVWRGLRRWYRLYAGPWGLHSTSQQLREQVATLQRRGHAILRKSSPLFLLTVARMRQHLRRLPSTG